MLDWLLGPDQHLFNKEFTLVSPTAPTKQRADWIVLFFKSVNRGTVFVDIIRPWSGPWRADQTAPLAFTMSCETNTAGLFFCCRRGLSYQYWSRVAEISVTQHFSTPRSVLHWSLVAIKVKSNFFKGMEDSSWKKGYFRRSKHWLYNNTLYNLYKTWTSTSPRLISASFIYFIYFCKGIKRKK